MRDKPCGCWGLHELLSEAKKSQTNILRIANAEEQGNSANTCTDGDFIISLAIMEILTTHSLMFATSLQKQKLSSSPMRKYFKVHNALERLKSTFTYSELIAVLLDSGFSEATANRYRVWLSDMYIIE